jgi:hypothetical protein
MADELILYTNPMSRGRIARWMLEEVGQPYKTEVLDYASTMKGRPYLAINPMRFRNQAWRRRPGIACGRLITGGCSSPPARSRPHPATKP